MIESCKTCQDKSKESLKASSKEYQEKLYEKANTDKRAETWDKEKMRSFLRRHKQIQVIENLKATPEEHALLQQCVKEQDKEDQKKRGVQ